MNTENPTSEQTAIQSAQLIDEGPKIGFLEAFSGILLAPKRVFDDLYKEDSFTVIIYGALAVFLSNLGKIEAGGVNLLSIIGAEIIGFVGWIFIGLLISFFGAIFKTPSNNLARLLGFTGLASIPYLLLAPVNLLSYFYSPLYQIFFVPISIWSFILFWIALSKSFQLEAWRVLLMAIIPFLLGLFLFTFMIANLLGSLLSGLTVR